MDGRADGLPAGHARPTAKTGPTGVWPSRLMIPRSPACGRVIPPWCLLVHRSGGWRPRRC